MQCHSAADVKACMLKVVPLKYAEEACYNGILIVQAFSSGLEIGSCNWSIVTPKGRIAYISNSLFSPVMAMSFNYKVFERSDVILYSDFSSCNFPEAFRNDSSCSGNSGKSLDSRCISFLQIMFLKKRRSRIHIYTRFHHFLCPLMLI